MNRIKIVILLILILIGIGGLINSKNKETNDEEMIEEAQTKIALYYTNPSNGELVKEYRYVALSKIKEDLAKTILEELIKNPTDYTMVSYIPTGTKINSVRKENDKIIVDLSKEFLQNEENEVTKLHKIYSVVNSLTEITEINKVEIDIDGEFYTEKERI